MAFSGSLISPFPVISGAFNDVGGKLIAPMPVLSGTLSMATSFKGALVSPFPVMSGVTGEVFSGKLVAPMPVMSGGFVSVTLFKGSLTSPMPVLKGTLGVAWVGKLVAPMPVLIGSLVGSTYQFNGVLVAPMPVMQGIISIPVSDSFNVLVMNLSNKFLSFYQNYNFNSACKFNGQYIAAGADGLYLLTGLDDNGTDIDASILLGDYDFGMDNIKTRPELFVNYSGDGDLQVSLNVDQDEMDGPYEIPAPHETKVQTRKARLPKGYRGSHYQYLLENVQGSHVNIQNLLLKFDVSKRSQH